MQQRKIIRAAFAIAWIALIPASSMLAQTSAPVVASKKVDNPQTITTASGLKYTITSVGNGKQAHKGDNVKVHYTGKLTDSTIFDSSVKKRRSL